MARYKYTDVENGQGLFLTVHLQKQLRNRQLNRFYR